MTLFNRDIIGDPAFARRPDRLSVFLWLALAGKNVSVHPSEISEATGLHARKIAAALSFLEKHGHITITGSGAIRTIHIVSPLASASGVYRSKRVGASGAGLWRGSALSAKIKKEVSARDGRICRYCGDTSGPFHFDHVTPVARGGRDNAANLVIACRTCNLSKRDRTPEEMGWKL